MANGRSRPAQNSARERRVHDEIIVDANGPEEQAMGWFCYLEEQLTFPFAARCHVRRAISPLRVDDQVVVTGMAPEDECAHEMFVEVRWNGRHIAVPLSQLEICSSRGVSAGTREAVADWHYWTGRGYEL